MRDIQMLGVTMKISAFEFANIVDQEIEQLKPEDMRLRAPRSVKKLIEEKRPLSRLALSLKTAGVDIFVEMTSEGDKSDAIIYEHGYRERTLNIQITNGFDYEEALRMEHLNTHGHTPGAGPINRHQKTGEVQAELVAVNSDSYVQGTGQKIIELFDKKVGMQYENQMVLLIGFFEWKIKGLGAWTELYSLIQHHIASTNHGFSEVYLYNEASNELQKIA